MTVSLPNGQSQLLSQLTQRLTLTDAQFRRICQLIYQRAGIVLADHKRDMVYNRLVRRLRTLNLEDLVIISACWKPIATARSGRRLLIR